VTVPAPALYDRIGTGYATTRRPDPGIQRVIMEALGTARSVVNVGAGTGSYEPDDRLVVAVDPSREMLRQRGRGQARFAPATLGVAEALPFPDRAFDAAMALLTIHHWTDQPAGLRELRRVARQRVVIFTWDPDLALALWFVRDYLGPVVAVDTPRFPPIATLCAGARAAKVIPVPIPHDCADGFFGAHWRRPEAYLDPAVRQGISVFRQLPPDVVAQALAALEVDLRTGRWAERHGDLLGREELDLGYRLVVLEG
jgi:SAM-dependent methyltransferase